MREIFRSNSVKLVGLIGVFLLFSCLFLICMSGNASDKVGKIQFEPDQTKIKRLNGSYNLSLLTYEGHEYLMFGDGLNAACIIHSKSCPKCVEEKEFTE